MEEKILVIRIQICRNLVLHNLNNRIKLKREVALGLSSQCTLLVELELESINNFKE